MQIIIELDEILYGEFLTYGIVGLNVDNQIEISKAIRNGTPLPKCNECKYYKGIHKCQGHAPCSFPHNGGVLWNWYCSQFEKWEDKDANNN